MSMANLVPRALFPGFGGGAGKGKSALGTRLVNGFTLSLALKQKIGVTLLLN